MTVIPQIFLRDPCQYKGSRPLKNFPFGVFFPGSAPLVRSFFRLYFIINSSKSAVNDSDIGIKLFTKAYPIKIHSVPVLLKPLTKSIGLGNLSADCFSVCSILVQFVNKAQRDAYICRNPQNSCPTNAFNIIKIAIPCSSKKGTNAGRSKLSHAFTGNFRTVVYLCKPTVGIGVNALVDKSSPPLLSILQ